MGDGIVNAVLIGESIEKLEKKIEKFNKSATKLSWAMIGLTIVMVIEVAIQIWIAYK